MTLPYVSLQVKTNYNFHPVKDDVDPAQVKSEHQSWLSLYRNALLDPLGDLRILQ